MDFIITNTKKTGNITKARYEASKESITFYLKGKEFIGFNYKNRHIFNMSMKNKHLKVLKYNCNNYYVTNINLIIKNTFTFTFNHVEVDLKVLEQYVQRLDDTETALSNLSTLKAHKSLSHHLDMFKFISEKDDQIGDVLYKTSTFKDSFNNIVEEVIVFNKANGCEYLETTYNLINHSFDSDLF